MSAGEPEAARSGSAVGAEVPEGSDDDVDAPGAVPDVGQACACLCERPVPASQRVKYQDGLALIPAGADEDRGNCGPLERAEAVGREVERVPAGG